MNEVISKPTLPPFLQPFDQDGDGALSLTEIAQIRKLPDSNLAAIEEKTAYLIVLEILDAGRIAREKLVPTEGISFDEFRILALLHSKGAPSHRQLPNGMENETQVLSGISQLTIANETNLSTSTVSTLLDKIDVARVGPEPESRGWIMRIENPSNRREKLVSLTQAGRIHFRRARLDYSRQIRSSLVSGMDLERLLYVREVLFNFNATLDPSHDPSAGDSDSDVEQ